MEVGKPWQEQSPQRLPPMSDSNAWYPYSWSPDGRRLAGGRRTAVGAGIIVYSLESQQYEKLADFGTLFDSPGLQLDEVVPVWLSDSRRLLFHRQGKLYLIDSQSKKVREVLSVAPSGFGYGITLSRDDRLICFSLLTTEADIWLMSLE
jgi:Tol biopolymer transport system component